MKERDTNSKDLLSDKGAKHTLLIELFRARKEKRVATREELRIALANNVYDQQLMVSEASLNTAIHDLRRTLEKIGSGFEIETVIKLGYRVKCPEKD